MVLIVVYYACLVMYVPIAALAHLRNPVTHIVGVDKINADCCLAPSLEELKAIFVILKSELLQAYLPSKEIACNKFP